MLSHLFLSVHQGLMDVVVAAGTHMTYVGEPGSIHPDRTLQHAPIASLAQQLAVRVRGKSVVLTCPVTLERSARETVVENLFEHAQVEALYLLSEPIAACYATGCEKIRVLDCGHTHATVSFVENGQTTKFIQSKRLGVHGVAGEDPLDTAERIAAAHEAWLGSGGKTWRTLLNRLPPEADRTPILLCGGAFEMPTTIQRSQEQFNETLSDDVISFAKPSLTHYLGASLFGSLDDAEKLLITRSTYDEEGRSAVHWRCPI